MPALGLALAALAGASAAADELSMEEIVSMLSERQLGQVYEVEREHDGYEVKILDPEGAWLVLYLDATTGEVLHEERSAPGAETVPDGPDEADDDPEDSSDPSDDEADDESSQDPDREGDA